MKYRRYIKDGKYRRDERYKKIKRLEIWKNRRFRNIKSFRIDIIKGTNENYERDREIRNIKEIENIKKYKN